MKSAAEALKGFKKFNPKKLPVEEPLTPGHRACQGCGEVLALRLPPLIMGVVNVTPDSFSDGGRFDEPSRAAEQAERMVTAGAAIIDVGGESTRPGAAPVSEAEELARGMLARR